MRKILYYVVIAISTLLILASLLSLLYNLPYWYSKLLDFPRLQYLILGIICLLLVVVLTKKWKWPATFLLLGLVAAILIQTIRIFPYWFGDTVVPDATQAYNAENTLSIMLANVLITNKESQKLLQMVHEANPDILIAMEVNERWLGELERLKNEYPYVITQPNDEAYGMALYSKNPLTETEIKYIKHKNVPSFHSTVTLPSGKKIKVHAVHPVAPMPSDKYPDNVGTSENELLKVGEMVSKDNIPAIVAGDFNDVSWSNTSRLFEEAGVLNNVRLGRGLYNTFDATSFFMRWPLDHYFVTEEFKVIELKRLSEFGSDHFPMLATFVVTN